MLHMRVAGTAFAVSVALGGTSEAATVSGTVGEMQINAGAGFKVVAGPAVAGPGALVMVAAGGSAQIAYEDGCVVKVTPGRVEMVGRQSPCATTQASNQPVNPMTTGATPPPVEIAAAASLSPTYAIGGLAVVAATGGFLAVREAQRQEKRHPSSP